MKHHEIRVNKSKFWVIAKNMYLLWVLIQEHGTDKTTQISSTVNTCLGRYWTLLPSTSSYRGWSMCKIHLPTDSCVLGTCHVTQPVWSGSCNIGTTSTNCSFHLIHDQNNKIYSQSSLFPIPNMFNLIRGTAKHYSQFYKCQH